MSACAACSGSVEPVLSFGRMPLANAFLSAEQFDQESFFDLALGFCPNCALAQLIDPVGPEKMFHSKYPFFTSSSVRMVQHFQAWARQAAQRHLNGADPFVVEIGSNDGSLLEVFAQAGIRHLGVEPSANVAAVAEGRGVRTICRFFGEQTAREIVRGHGQADAILAANCFCHIPDLRDLAAGLDILLRPGGTVMFEDPYLGDIVENVAVDQVYDEHVHYFSLASVSSWLAGRGFEVHDVEPQAVHGGSMRFVFGRTGEREPAATVKALREKETRLGLEGPRVFAGFRAEVERMRDELVSLLEQLRARGQRVVGYGATSKSTTILNYCGISTGLVEFIVDSTPLKQGKFSPGMHIPIRPTTEFRPFPDYALLFAWNHAAEIFQKEREFTGHGGRWLTYVPRVRVVEEVGDAIGARREAHAEIQ